MTHRVLLRSPATASQKNVPLLEEAAKKKKTKKVAEVAGGTAADCAAVCCCCPCSVMNLVILAVYKVPARLCNKVKKRHLLKRKSIQKQSLLFGSSSSGCREELEREVREIAEREKEKINNSENDGEESDAIILEREMWAKFYGTGFWRSPSQRST